MVVMVMVVVVVMVMYGDGCGGGGRTSTTLDTANGIFMCSGDCDGDDGGARYRFV